VYVQLSASVNSEVDDGIVSVAFGFCVEVSTAVGVDDGLVVEVGTPVCTIVASGVSVVMKTCSLLCTLLGFKTMARIQPAVTTMITRIAIGNHNCLILFTRKLADIVKFDFAIHFHFLPSRDFPQPLRKIFLFLIIHQTGEQEI
jgi:hypothetical protein